MARQVFHFKMADKEVQVPDGHYLFAYYGNHPMFMIQVNTLLEAEQLEQNQVIQNTPFDWVVGQPNTMTKIPCYGVKYFCQNSISIIDERHLIPMNVKF